MDAVLYLRKSYRNWGIGSGLFFLGMMAFSVCAILADNGNVLAACAFGVFWGCWVGSSVYVLLAYYRESLAVKDGRITQTGILHRREMGLAEVVDVHWRLNSAGGSVVLRSASRKIKVYLDNFELEQRRCLIRWLHLSLPSSIQRDWEQFCLRRALPLLKSGVDAPLGPNEVLLTRRRWDRFFVWATLIALAVGAVLEWQFKSHLILSCPAACIVTWLLMRFTTPRQGMRCPKMAVAPERRQDIWFLWFSLVWFIVAIAAAIVIPHNIWAICGWMIPWFAVLIFLSHRLDRRRSAIDDAKAAQAVEEWNRLENTSAGSAHY